MPRYGDAESVVWFDVEPFCMFHLINCFEEGDEVHTILRGAELGFGPLGQWPSVARDLG